MARNVTFQGCQAFAVKLRGLLTLLQTKKGPKFASAKSSCLPHTANALMKKSCCKCQDKALLIICTRPFSKPRQSAGVWSQKFAKSADEKLNKLLKNEKPSQLFVSQLEMKPQNWGESFYVRLKLKKKNGAVKRLSFHHEKPKELSFLGQIFKKRIGIKHVKRYIWIKILNHDDQWYHMVS